MPHHQRRKKFVDAKVQGALARRLVFHWLLFFAMASFMALALQVLTDPLRPVAEHLRNAWLTHGPFVVVMVFLLPAFLVDTIKLSHRFAGPIVALRRSMREIIQGGPPRKLNFRDGDFWHELADEYNAMLARLAPDVETEEPVDQSAEPVAVNS